MKFGDLVQEQAKDPVEDDPKVVAAVQEVERMENDLQKKKQALYQLKARVAQNMARQQARAARTVGEAPPEQR